MVTIRLIGIILLAAAFTVAAILGAVYAFRGESGRRVMAPTFGRLIGIVLLAGAIVVAVIFGAVYAFGRGDNEQVVAPPPEATPTVATSGTATAPPLTTVTAKGTIGSDGDAAPPSPTAPQTPNPVRTPSTSVPAQTPEPAGSAVTTQGGSGDLPDLVIEDLVLVGGFRIAVVVSNIGSKPLPTDTAVEITVRGALERSVPLKGPLGPGDRFTLFVDDQALYGSEVVNAQVDPNDLIREQNEANNDFSVFLEPQVMPDIAPDTLSQSDSTQSKGQLVVNVRNHTSAPVIGASVIIQAFRCGSTEAAATMHTTIDLPGDSIMSIELSPSVAVHPGECWRVTIESLDIPDADPTNNQLECRIDSCW